MTNTTFTNTTNIKVPAKYASKLELVERDEDGYWAYSLPGWFFPSTGCHSAHEDKQADLLREIRGIEKCDCDQCVPVQKVEVVEEPKEENKEESVNTEIEKPYTKITSEDIVAIRSTRTFRSNLNNYCAPITVKRVGKGVYGIEGAFRAEYPDRIAKFINSSFGYL